MGGVGRGPVHSANRVPQHLVQNSAWRGDGLSVTLRPGEDSQQRSGYWAPEQDGNTDSDPCTAPICPGLTGTGLSANTRFHFQSVCQAICAHLCRKKDGIHFFTKKADPSPGNRSGSETLRPPLRPQATALRYPGQRWSAAAGQGQTSWGTPHRASAVLGPDQSHAVLGSISWFLST